MASFLTVAQGAMSQLAGRRPAAVFSSTDEMAVEITAIGQEVAEEIMKAHDWQALIKFEQLTTDGTSEAYAMPADYDRMVQATEIQDPQNWFWGYTHIMDINQWMRMKISRFGLVPPGVWTMFQNQFHFMPMPEAGKEALFAYVSENVVRDSNGNAKATFTADTDEFVLNDRLLKLGIIWKWLALKRMDYQQEFEDFQLAFSQEATRDRGARVIRKRSGYVPLATRWAWPGVLGGE